VQAVARAIGPSIARALELEEKSRAIGRLQRLDRLEKEFLALITHDMRTPLAVIGGLAANLRENWQELPDGERLEGLDAILRNERSLTRLVEHDLELALIDAGRLQYDITAFDMADDVGLTINDFARTAGARISLRVDAPLPLVRADRQRNGQILGNLLSNAVKYSPSGAAVEVRVFHRASMVHVSVGDEGAGIAAADVSKLFRKFSRCDASDGRRVRGTGLGLYLSRRMVEAQGGRIWVESRPSHGATFVYTLPAAVRAANGRG
jgi:signal transduction histidine kinase